MSRAQCRFEGEGAAQDPEPWEMGFIWGHRWDRLPWRTCLHLAFLPHEICGGK